MHPSGREVGRECIPQTKRIGQLNLCEAVPEKSLEVETLQVEKLRVVVGCQPHLL